MFWLLMNTRTTTETLVLALSEMSIVITMVITNGLKIGRSHGLSSSLNPAV